MINMWFVNKMWPENSTLFAAKYDDDKKVSDLISHDEKFIGMLSSMLDTGMNGWKLLASQLTIKPEISAQFGLTSPGPTAQLFLYMSTTDGLKDLTVGELREHFEAMKLKALANILEQYEGLCFASHIINLSKCPRFLLCFDFLLFHSCAALTFVEPSFPIEHALLHFGDWYASETRWLYSLF